MRFGGDVQFGVASRTNIELVSAFPGDGFDQINIDGTAFLAGALQLTAYAPLGADVTLPIIEAGELVGSFSSVPALGADLDNGVRFGGVTYDYNHDEVLLSLLQGMSGDFNADGAVDGADFMVWQRSFGATVARPGTGADANFDGAVTTDDLAMWKAAAGATQSAVQAAVPEPAAIASLVSGLVVVSTGGFFLRRRL